MKKKGQKSDLEFANLLKKNGIGGSTNNRDIVETF